MNKTNKDTTNINKSLRTTSRNKTKKTLEHTHPSWPWDVWSPRVPRSSKRRCTRWPSRPTCSCWRPSMPKLSRSRCDSPVEIPTSLLCAEKWVVKSWLYQGVKIWGKTTLKIGELSVMTGFRRLDQLLLTFLGLWSASCFGAPFMAILNIFE